MAAREALKGSWDLESKVRGEVVIRITLLRAPGTLIKTLVTISPEPLSPEQKSLKPQPLSPKP